MEKIPYEPIYLSPNIKETMQALVRRMGTVAIQPIKENANG